MSDMTREEAVIILDGFKNNPLFNSTHTRAFDMAISALSENKGFDGMTNGEVIKALFPIVGIGVFSTDDGSEITEYEVEIDEDNYMSFSPRFWNSPYKGVSE